MKLPQSEDTAHREPPAARGGANPNVGATLMVDGANLKIHPIMGDLDYLDSEESLRLALHGGDTMFGESLPQKNDSKGGVHINQTETSANDPKFPETVRLNDAAQSEHKRKFLEKYLPIFPPFRGLELRIPLGVKRIVLMIVYRRPSVCLYGGLAFPQG